VFDYLKADLRRLGNHESTFRCLIRGLLSQGFQAILVYRWFRWLKKHGIPAQPFRFIFERFIEITTGISIPVEADIGPGFRIHHFGGIILHPSTKMGRNCTLYHQVTIGDYGGNGGAAKIGDNVMMGAGAKIIGEITIGDNCKIGANAVVIKDIPDCAIVFGNPAIVKILPNIQEK